MSANSVKVFSYPDFSESEPGTPGLGISVFKWSWTQKAIGMSPQPCLSLQRGSENRALMGKSCLLNCASSSRSCMKPLPGLRTRYGSQLCFTEKLCILAQICHICTWWQFTSAVHPHRAFPCLRRLQHQGWSNIWPPCLQFHGPATTGPATRSCQQTHLSWLVRTRCSARNPSFPQAVLSPGKWQYDFSALGLASLWFSAALRSMFSCCGLSNPVRFCLIFAFTSYLSNRFIFPLLSSIRRSHFKSVSQRIHKVPKNKH